MQMSDLLIFGIGSVSLAFLMSRHYRHRTAEHAARKPMSKYVRVAGPSEMINPPRKWDLVDETVDESFPASDPPATY